MTNAPFLQRPITVKRLLAAIEGVVEKSVSQITEITESTVTGDFRVLVVDDSFPVRKYMENKLPSIVGGPLSINYAESGRAAMEFIWAQDVDLIFLDVMMPGINGYSVCKAIKAEKLSYVVMLTGKKSPFDRVRGTMSGCDAYLTKPPQDKRLKEVVYECLVDLGRISINPILDHGSEVLAHTNLPLENGA